MKYVKRPLQYQALRVITECPRYKSSDQIQARCSLKIFKEEAHITFISKAFHILPAVYAIECSIMFVRGASKTSLSSSIAVIIDKLIYSKSTLMRLCIIFLGSYIYITLLYGVNSSSFYVREIL